MVWERPRVRFSEALCSLGLVRYVDMYGGTDDEGRGDWLEWDQFYHLMEAAEWQHSPAAMAAMEEDYEQTIGAMEADEMAVEWLREYAKGWPPWYLRYHRRPVGRCSSPIDSWEHGKLRVGSDGGSASNGQPVNGLASR